MGQLDDFLNLFADPRAVEADRERLAQAKTAMELQRLIAGGQQPFSPELFPGEQNIPGLSTEIPGALPKGVERDFISKLLGSGSKSFSARGVGLAEGALNRIRQGRELKSALTGGGNLSEQLKRTAQIPDRFAQSISNLRQLQTSSPRPDFTNFQIDDTGQAFGFNVESRRVEKIPQKDLLTKYKTVQGVGLSGLPETQLIRAGSGGELDRIKVGEQTPPGFRMSNTPGVLEEIPGGPKDINIRATQAQREASSFAFRAEESNREMESLMNDGFEPSSSIEALSGLTNVTASANKQVFNRAKQDFVTAILRKESGAVINKDEFDREDKKYFPQFGDSRSVIKSKERGRRIAIKVLKNESGGLFKAEHETQKQSKKITEKDILGMTDDELKAYISGI